MNEKERTNREGRTLLRIASELRGFLSNAPEEDENAYSILRDVETLERIGNWLATVNPIQATDGIPAIGSIDDFRKKQG